MSEERVKPKLTVNMKYEGKEITFSGDVDDVIRGIFRFLSEVYPAYEVVSRVTISTDVMKLLDAVKDVIVKTPEGLVINLDTTTMPDRELILLHLLKVHIAYMLNLSKEDSCVVKEIVEVTRGKKGAIAGRLSELTKSGFVKRVEKGKYSITTLGIKHVIDEIIPKYKPKAEAK